MTLAAVAFDLDDTLVVPDRDRQTLLDEATAATDTAAIERSEYLAVHQEDRATTTRTPIFEALVDDGDPQSVAQAYRDAVNDALVPVPGVADLFADLRTQYRVGLLTDGPVEAQQTKLETLGWEDAFDAVVITGALPAGKPDQRAFEAITEELGVAPGVTAYVGDNPDADIRGANDAGMVTVQVLGEAAERSPDADWYVDRDRLGAGLREFLTHRQQSG